MNLFDIFKTGYWRTPRIPREIFVEDSDDYDFNPEANHTNNIMSDSTSKINEIHYRYGSINCRKELDDFLSRDFDSEGYQAALVNADSSNMDSHTGILRLQLQRIVENSLALYENENRYYDADIKIHTNQGMMDNVDKLNVGKANNQEAINRIQAMYAEAQQGKGVGYLPVLSFEQGFKRGISSKTFL
jgi:hypothetical protein